MARGAPLEAKDSTWNNTPLGWALHGWLHPVPEKPSAAQHESVVRMLVGAGAAVSPGLIAECQGHPEILAALER